MTRFDTDAVACYIANFIQQGDKPTLEGVAEHFHLSYFYFSHQFKQQFGVTFKAYISACRVEYSQHQILKGDSVTSAQLGSGFESLGTFSTTFKSHAGLSPKKYASSLLGMGKKFAISLLNPPECLPYHSFDIGRHKQPYKLTVEVENIASKVPSLTFVGLYPKPIPKGFPVVGFALGKGNQCTITSIPNGSYHVLACQLQFSVNPISYFHVTQIPRAIYPKPITFPLTKSMYIEIELRESVPSDPPITVNLPKLFFEALRRQFSTVA